MTAMKLYPIKCHVCGNEFDHEAEFLSVQASTRGENGEVRLVGTCNFDKSPPQHTTDEIKASYNARFAQR
jgi:hypothetical protein